MLLTLLLALIVHVPPDSAPGADYRYTFRSQGEGNAPAGTVFVNGDDERIDLDRPSSRGTEYILLKDNDKHTFVVYPDRRVMQEINSDTFADAVGVSLRTTRGIMHTRVSNASVKSQLINSTTHLLGCIVSHYRVIQRFDVQVKVFGLFGGTEHHAIRSDYWICPGLSLGTNPLLQLIENATAGLARADTRYEQLYDSVRRSLPPGAALRTEVRDEVGADADSTTDVSATPDLAIEITSITRVINRSSMFRVPRGFRVEDFHELR